jgi:hypothetical protein
VEAIFGEEHASLLQYGIDYGLKSFRVHASCANALVHNNMQDLQKNCSRKGRNLAGESREATFQLQASLFC